MPTSRSVFAIVSCGALDAALAAHLLAADPSARGVLATIGAHLAISIAAGFALAGAMPGFVSARRLEVVATGASIAASVPVLGALGMLVVVRFGLTRPRERFGEPWAVVDLQQDFEKRHRHPLRTRRADVSALEIRAVLRQRSDESVPYRFKSVLAIQKLPPKAGVPLLKLAQSDPSDEIRLYAFSRLERMRDDLERKVKELTASLEQAANEEGARLHLRLAQSYWELGYLGLAEGAVLAHALASAHRHAAIASEMMPRHAPAEFFLGRILLELREPERALIGFERAAAAGYPRVRLLPWLAECAFHRRDFGSVRRLLDELEVASPENLFSQAVSDFWAERAPDRLPPLRRGSRESLRIGSDQRLGEVRQP